MTDSIRQCLDYAVSQLPGDTAELDAQILLTDILQKPRSHLYAWPDQRLSAGQAQQFYHAVQQCLAGMPVAYIVGWQEFWSLPLAVNEHTLIPRPETELLVETVLQQHRASDKLNLLDAGTGSGAIALALASEKPQWQILASDLSAGALAVASGNSQRLQLPVNFVQMNWLEAIAGQSLDVVVSNPPYIAGDDEHLAALQYEPQSALVAENDGLAAIDTVCQQSRVALKPGGALYIEHGHDQAAAVCSLFVANGFSDVRTLLDYAGCDRLICGVKHA